MIGSDDSNNHYCTGLPCSICHPQARRVVRVRATYQVVTITGTLVTIKDLDGRVSVTNDAEAVVAEVLQDYPGRKIHYYDTDGNLDELCHDGTKFTGFAPVQTEGRT